MAERVRSCRFRNAFNSRDWHPQETAVLHVAVF